MGADSREELLNGQVNHLNVKVARKLFQMKGVTWRETENQVQKEKSTFAKIQWEGKRTGTSCSKGENEWKDLKVKETWMRRVLLTGEFFWIAGRKWIFSCSESVGVGEVYKVWWSTIACSGSLPFNLSTMKRTLRVSVAVQDHKGRSRKQKPGSSGSSLPMKLCAGPWTQIHLQLAVSGTKVNFRICIQFWILWRNKWLDGQGF